MLHSPPPHMREMSTIWQIGVLTCSAHLPFGLGSLGFQAIAGRWLQTFEGTKTRVSILAQKNAPFLI